MKRKVVLVAGLVALAIGLYVGTRVTAKPNETPAPTSSRVCVMNMQKVANDYTRTGVLRQEIESTNGKYETDLKNIQEEMKKYSVPQTDPKLVEQYQKQLVSLKRQGEDKTAERNKVVGDKYVDGEKEIFKDIEAAVAALAKSRNVDLVFYYNDVPDSAAKYSPQALQKRISASGMPIYTGQGTEITNDVVHVLNYNWERNHPSSKGSQP